LVGGLVGWRIFCFAFCFVLGIWILFGFGFDLFLERYFWCLVFSSVIIGIYSVYIRIYTIGIGERERRLRKKILKRLDTLGKNT
jgi:hypothetical protein